MQEIILVQATRDILARDALISKGSADPHRYRSGVFVKRGTVGIVDGISAQDSEYRTVSFEDKFRGFVTIDVYINNLAVV